MVANRDSGNAPIWDAIIRTVHWDLVHAYNTSLAGWLVLVVRRHLTAIEQLSDDEAGELGVLLRDVSAAMGQAIGCVKTYVVQFAEAVDHPHVHFHIVPRMADQPEAFKGPNVFRYLGVEESQRISESTMSALALKIRTALATRVSATQPLP